MEGKVDNMSSYKPILALDNAKKIFITKKEV